MLCYGILLVVEPKCFAEEDVSIQRIRLSTTDDFIFHGQQTHM